MVRVLVPATTANLGPGFDCFGLALRLYNRVQLEAMPRGLEIIVTGEGADGLPRDETNLVYRAARTLFDRVGGGPPGLRLALDNDIPLMSGLGSSAAAVVGGVVAANELAGRPLSRADLLALAVALEGHPDNVAPALLGGLVVVGVDEGSGVISAHADVPALQVAVAVPALHFPTAEARRLLPAEVPLTDAVFNVSRAALVLLALQHGDYELLGRAMADRLHQPYRGRLIPGFQEVRNAACEAGAAAVALSGAGPSVVAFAPEGHKAIAQAMKRTFAEYGIEARVMVLEVEREGARVG